MDGLSTSKLIKPRIKFRREGFGGLGFETESEEYYYLDRNGFELLSLLDSYSFFESKIQNLLVNNSELRKLLDMGVIGQTNDVTLHEVPSIPTRSDQLTAPVNVELYPTFRCNERCEFCYVGPHLDEHRRYPEMDERAIEKIVSVIHDNGMFFVTILGGEPFLFTGLLFLLKKLHEAGVNVAISTNGTIFKEEYLEAIKEFGVNLNLSLHSFRPQQHNKIVKHHDAFAIALKTISKAQELGIPLHISTVLTPEISRDILDHLNFVIDELGVTALTLLYIQPSGFASNNKLHISFADFEAAYKRARKYVDGRNGISLQTSCYFNFLLEEFRGTYNEQNPIAHLMYGCSAGLSKIEVVPNGDIYPCSFFFGIQDWRVGNILTDDFKDMWDNSPIFWRFRNRRLSSTCNQCEFSEVCRGGIICENILEQGRFSLEPPNCPIHNPDK